MKTPLRLLAVVWIITTTSCTSVYSTQPSPSQTNTALPQTISPIETATQIPPPSPTVLPFLSWSNDLQGKLFYLGKYEGIWSPTANELFLVSRLSPWLEGESILKKAAPPDFDAVTMTHLKFYSESLNPTWSPDGKYILLNGPYPEKPPFEQGYASVWIMDRAGNNLRSLQPDRPANYREGFYGGFLGWVNDHTVVYIYGSGSGFAHIEGIDIATGKSLFVDDVSSGVFQPHGEFIPFVAMGRTGVIDTKFYDPTHPQYTYPYVRDLTIDEKNVNALFQDWRPGSNTILILVTKYDVERILPSPELGLWNLDTDDFEAILPNAIYARFSSDGKTLAYLTLGPAKLDAAGKPVASAYTVESRKLSRYIQFFDMQSQVVTFSSPILVQNDPYADQSEYSDDYLYLAPYMTFSPNGQYLAFLTPDGDRSILKIVDTLSREILYAIPSYNGRVPNNRYGGDLLSWSPDNDKILYRDEDANPILLSVKTGKKIALTSAGGPRVDYPSWSFDGHYLLVSFWDSYDYPPTWLMPESVVIYTP